MEARGAVSHIGRTGLFHRRRDFVSHVPGIRQSRYTRYLDAPALSHMLPQRIFPRRSPRSSGRCCAVPLVAANAETNVSHVTSASGSGAQRQVCAGRRRWRRPEETGDATEAARPVSAALAPGCAAPHRNAEGDGLVDEVVGDAAARESDDALGQQVQQLIVAAERRGASVSAKPLRAGLCQQPARKTVGSPTFHLQ